MQNGNLKEILSSSKIIVIKIGSSLLINKNGNIKEDWLSSISKDILYLLKSKKKIIIVSSGATALGLKKISFKINNKLKNNKQTAASVGQIILSEKWSSKLEQHNINTAQILLTYNETEERKKYLSIKSTISNLLEYNIIPIINENDAINSNSNVYGDNDHLASRISVMIGADILILLTDVNGIYTDNPKNNPFSKHIPIINSIDKSIEEKVKNTLSEFGTGGMITKLSAAKIAKIGGCNTIITSGTVNNPLHKLFTGDLKSTLIKTNNSSAKSKKNWIAGTIKTNGTIILDEGAVDALYKGKSLLPVGVTQVTGDFELGSTIIILNNLQKEIARGIISYNSDDAKKIIKKKLDKKIDTILGYKNKGPLIHRDNLVIIKKHN